MPRRPNKSPVVCEFFTWRLFERRGVIYADCRSKKHNLGKHSLATRDLPVAMANLKILDRRKAVELGLAAPAPKVADAVSIPDGWDLFLGHCKRGRVMGGVSANTLKRYRAVRDKHQAFCERESLHSWNDVNKAAVEKYGNWLTSNNYSDRSIYLELTLVKSVIGWLIDGSHLSPSCRFRLPLCKPEGTDTYCYSREEVVAILEYCRQRSQLSWLGTLIGFLACTGLRIGEVASLRWSDVDWQSRTISLTDERASSRRRKFGVVRTTKGKRNRALPIHDELVPILQSIERHADGKIFHGPLGGQLKPDTVRNILFREVITPLKKQFPTPPGEIGFEHGRLHSFRHYFCSQAFRDGAAEAEIKEWMGHRDSKMVAHYRHLRKEDGQRKMNQIGFLSEPGRTVRTGS